jgi:hypothetical protein
MTVPCNTVTADRAGTAAIDTQRNPTPNCDFAQSTANWLGAKEHRTNQDTCSIRSTTWGAVEVPPHLSTSLATPPPPTHTHKRTHPWPRRSSTRWGTHNRLCMNGPQTNPVHHWNQHSCTACTLHSIPDRQPKCEQCILAQALQHTLAPAHTPE